MSVRAFPATATLKLSGREGAPVSVTGTSLDGGLKPAALSAYTFATHEPTTRIVAVNDVVVTSAVMGAAPDTGVSSTRYVPTGPPANGALQVRSTSDPSPPPVSDSGAECVDTILTNVVVASAPSETVSVIRAVPGLFVVCAETVHDVPLPPLDSPEAGTTAGLPL